LSATRDFIPLGSALDIEQETIVIKTSVAAAALLDRPWGLSAASTLPAPKAIQQRRRGNRCFDHDSLLFNIQCTSERDKITGCASKL